MASNLNRMILSLHGKGTEYFDFLSEYIHLYPPHVSSSVLQQHYFETFRQIFDNLQPDLNFTLHAMKCGLNLRAFEYSETVMADGALVNNLYNWTQELTLFIWSELNSLKCFNNPLVLDLMLEGISGDDLLIIISLAPGISLG